MSSQKAEINPAYRNKFLLIGIIALTIGLYHFYDPVIRYPSIRPISQAKAEIDALDVTDGEKQRQWIALAEKNGWPESDPYTEAELTTYTIYSYFIAILFTFFVGIPCLVTGLRCFGQWYAVDERGLTNSKGQSVTFDQIQSIDKTKWEKKGIAKLTYSDAGQEKVFVIDDLKFDRAVSDQIMSLVEETVGVDKIISGKSEVDYQKIRDALAAEKAAKQAAEEEGAL